MIPVFLLQRYLTVAIFKVKNGILCITGIVNWASLNSCFSFKFTCWFLYIFFFIVCNPGLFFFWAIRLCKINTHFVLLYEFYWITLLCIALHCTTLNSTEMYYFIFVFLQLGIGLCPQTNCLLTNYLSMTNSPEKSHQNSVGSTISWWKTTSVEFKGAWQKSVSRPLIRKRPFTSHARGRDWRSM